ncbi:MAG: carboxypeptidase-like regulatory domain-containing protein, partial [Candidatus Acidiferrum sp.]
MRFYAQGNTSLDGVRMAGVVRVLAIVCLMLFAVASAQPQGSTGRILGVVTDQTGGEVAGATVTITDVARGVAQTLITDSDGAYVA